MCSIFADKVAQTVASSLALTFQKLVNAAVVIFMFFFSFPVRGERHTRKRSWDATVRATFCDVTVFLCILRKKNTSNSHTDVRGLYHHRIPSIMQSISVLFLHLQSLTWKCIIKFFYGRNLRDEQLLRAFSSAVFIIIAQFFMLFSIKNFLTREMRNFLVFVKYFLKIHEIFHFLH